MGVILDTSVLVAAERGPFDIRRFIKGREDEPFGISVITASELLHGVYRADTEKRRLRREAYVEKIIESFPIYNFDLRVARIYSRIWANLVAHGIRVGAHDLIIASTAIAAGFSVVTLNMRDFEKITELTVEKLVP
ncbi:MAG: type II toxin-antitoxin system VapC family toxin [Thermodesulfobacteriota bacterium]